MSRERFEYSTGYFPLAYEAVREGVLFMKGPAMPTNPLTSEFVQSDDCQAYLKGMGADGWELVSVQPALKATLIPPKKEGQAIAYPTTAGYFFFWKRVSHG